MCIAHTEPFRVRLFKKAKNVAKNKMKQTYHIHGMTCNGCRIHVEETLSKVEGVSKAMVDLERAEATVDMVSHLPIEKFEEALKNDGGSYSIHNLGEHHHNINHSNGFGHTERQRQNRWTSAPFHS